MKTLKIGLGLVLTLGWLNSTIPQVQALPVSSIIMAQTGILTQQSLKNATYSIPEQGQVTLNNGSYTRQSGDPLSVTLGDKMAIGDINGDGVQDAAVVLQVNTGGSGVFVYLAVVVAQNNIPNNINTIALGDRVQVKSLSILKSNKIRVKMLVQGPNDAACCPSQEEIQGYSLNLKTNQLTLASLTDEETSNEQVEDVSSPPEGMGDNVPDQPPDNEIEIKF